MDGSCQFSVVIPTYRGAKRLPQVLQWLQAQVGTEAIAWEILICDNNPRWPNPHESLQFEVSGATAAVVQQFQDAAGNLIGSEIAQFQTEAVQSETLDIRSVPLRYCFVPDRGTAFARQVGVEQARGDWIGFLDDDNWPRPNWVAQAYQFAQQFSRRQNVEHVAPHQVTPKEQLGAFGSQIHAQFDQPPPTGFEAIAPFLAVVERGPVPQEYDRQSLVLPPGAGLVVRRSAWLNAVPQRLFLNHTGRDRGFASEDLEALIYLRRAGWQIWYNPAMEVYHHIPAERLQPRSLDALFRRIGLSRHHIRMLKLRADHSTPWPQKLLSLPLVGNGFRLVATLAYAANDLRKLGQIGMEQDPIDPNQIDRRRCDRTYLLYSLLSPWVLRGRALAQGWQHTIRTFRRTFIQPFTPTAPTAPDAIPQDQVFDITVAIPTHNGAERLPGLLEALAQQITPAGLIWEILVIDNASQDDVRAIVERFQPSNTEPLGLGRTAITYLYEPRQGVAYARQRATWAARGTWLAFLDDDTRPDPNWLQAAFVFAQQYPQAGAFGGQIWPQYEGEPPAQFERIASFLAIKQGGDRPRRYQPDRLQLPAGAGLVVRRQAWIQSIPSQLRCTHGSGDDFELCIHLHRAGWEIWYNPQMHLTHQIPAWRLEQRALLALSWRVGSCICDLRLVGRPLWQHPWIRLRVFGGNFKRLIRHWHQHRPCFNPNFNRDIVTDCETTFFLSGLLSSLGVTKPKITKPKITKPKIAKPKIANGKR